MATTKQSTTNKSSTTRTASGNARTSTSKTQGSKTRTQTPRLHERAPRVVAQDTGYAIAAITDEALSFVRELPGRVNDLRAQTPQRIRTSPQRARATVTDVRETATKRLDTRVKRFETTFDKRAKAGRRVARDLQKDDRYKTVNQQLGRVLGQTSNTRSQLKGAVTSVRKTATTAVSAGVDAGRDQADTAKSQVKAATTSTKKSAQTAADAGSKIAG